MVRVQPDSSTAVMKAAPEETVRRSNRAPVHRQDAVADRRRAPRPTRTITVWRSSWRRVRGASRSSPASASSASPATGWRSGASQIGIRRALGRHAAGHRALFSNREFHDRRGRCRGRHRFRHRLEPMDGAQLRDGQRMQQPLPSPAPSSSCCSANSLCCGRRCAPPPFRPPWRPAADNAPQV